MASMYKPPSLTSPYTKTKQNPLINSIPGVAAAGVKGPVVNTQAAAVSDKPVSITPLQSFQEKIKAQTEQNRQHSEDLRNRVQTRTGFSKKYAIKNQRNGYGQQSQARGSQQGYNYKNAGGYQNGRIPANQLVRLSVGGAMIPKAASAFERMNAAYRAAYGRNINVSDSYRSLQGQIDVARRKPGLAAPPGTSVHGLGRALDLGVSRDPQLKAWLDANGAKYGYVNPAWARKKTRYEPWHWEFVG